MAFYAVAQPDPDVQGLPFAVVADDDGAHYVAPEGVEGPGADRITMLTEVLGVTPTNAEEWMQLAMTNMSMHRLGERIEAPTLDEAFTQAQSAVDDIVGASERTLRLREIDDAHARFSESAGADFDQDESSRSRDYNIWAADVDGDPEDELGFQLEAAGAVDPKQPHRWLPLTLDEEECAFCELDKDAQIHAGL